MQRSGLALAVLALLYEAPMHPYRMQQMIKERGKHWVINVGQRSQLYKTIDRLEQAGMVERAAVDRDGARPERTVYRVTTAGAAAAREWTIAMLSSPRPEFPEFTAGLAYLPLLSTEETAAALTTRLRAVRDDLATLDEGDLAAAKLGLPRVVLVESEYLRRHLQADAEWIESLLSDLHDGKLHWTEAYLRELAGKPEE